MPQSGDEKPVASGGEAEDSFVSDALQTATASDRWAAAMNSLENADQELLRPMIEQNTASDAIARDILKAVNARKAECVKRRWRVKMNGRDIIIRDVLDKISSWISKFLVIGDTLIQIDPVHAAAPWAALRLVMQTAVNDFETFGSILASVERLTNHIAMCTIFELQYLQSQHENFAIYPSLSRAVTKLYRNMLAYLCTIIRYYQLGTAIRYLKSIVTSKTDVETKYKPVEAAQLVVTDLAKLADTERASMILREVDENSSRLERAQKAGDSLQSLFRELQAPIVRSTDDLERIKDGLERETRVRVLKAISTIPYVQHHKSARKGRLDGTGTWLLEKTAFREWRCDSFSSVLWLHGIPGSGKTKLASLVIDELSETNKIAYFYCMRSPLEPFRGQCDKILANLVRQLASVKPNTPILSPVTEHYQEALDGFTEFEDQTWSSDESECVLKALLGEYPAVTIVIDALDEVPLDDRHELLDILGRLLKEAPNLLKIFISSRDNYDIVLQLEGSPNIHIGADDNQNDIVSFVQDRIGSARLLHGKLSDELREQISKVLTTGACGMFRWVELQIQSLKPLKIPADVLDRLGKLPPTLEGSYWKLYERIMASGLHASKLAMFIFQWLLYADDTIPAEGLASIASTAPLLHDSGKVEPATTNAQITVGEIIDVCENLVILRDGNFVFAHLSVREFLETLPKRQVDALRYEDGNAAIAVACLKYYLSKTGEKLEETLNVFQVTNSEELTEEVWRDEREHMICQAARTLDGGESAEAMRFAGSLWPQYTSRSGRRRAEAPLAQLIRQILVNKENPREVSPFFIFWSYFIRAKAAGSRVKFCTNGPPNPIWAAILHGWDDVLGEIFRTNCYNDIHQLQNVSRPTVPCLQRPLDYAFENDDTEIAVAILNATDDIGDSFLERVCGANKIDMVLPILAAKHGGFSSQLRALFVSAQNGHADILSLLIDYNPRLLDAGGTKAILCACSSGHMAALALLLENVDVTSGSICGQMLTAAAINSHDHILMFLLDKSTLNGLIKDEWLSKSLEIAISQGNEECTQILYAHGAKEEAVAVARAIKAQTPASSIRLIKAGFNVEGHYFLERSTPLHLAIQMGFENVVRELLAAGANPSSRDRIGQTPLHVAAAMGKYECTSLLLSNPRIDILAEDASQNLALDLAEENGRDAVASLIRKHMEKKLAELLEWDQMRQHVQKETSEKGGGELPQAADEPPEQVTEALRTL